MSKLILLISSLFLTGSTITESIYIHAVVTIEGENKTLSSYQGKKMLIVTLPVIQNTSNDSLLHSLDSIQSVYSSTLKIIGVPSYEDGYSPTIKENLKQWYRSILDNSIIITEGLYTRKTSGPLQHSLFKWLTDKSKNGHFDNDVEGPRQKFVVWTDGKLIGVVGPQLRISSNTMNNLLQE